MTDLSRFSQSQLERFQRHFSLAGFGPDAQVRLLDSRVLVIGAGGLGAPILTYLAAAGVGTIDVVDHDVVDRSNLHRQVIHAESDIDRPKTESAAETMRGLHPEIVIHEHREPITPANALEMVEPADIVVDGSDNFATRYIVSDACEMAGKPLVSGSILRFAGQVSLFWAGHGPSYRDLYPEAPDPGEVPSCSEAGVLGVLPGVVGTLMATETIKFLSGVGETLLGRVLIYDALTARFREIRLQPDPDRAPVTEVGADVSGLGGSGPQAAAPQASNAQAPGAQNAGTANGTSCAMPDANDAAAPGLVPGAADPFTGDVLTEEDIDVAGLRSGAEQGAFTTVVDVREPWEYAAGHVDGAVNVPLSELAQGSATVPGLDTATQSHPVVLYCKVGVRSRQAIDIIRRAQPEVPLRNLVGGYQQVLAAGPRR